MGKRGINYKSWRLKITLEIKTYFTRMGQSRDPLQVILVKIDKYIST
jgi:hypothetical protein